MSEGNKQTAVDWLASNLPTIDWDDPHYREILSKAKAMEKNQIRNAYYTGNDDVVDNPNREAWQYYNQTFDIEHDNGTQSTHISTSDR